jgi:hypothetical protein
MTANEPRLPNARSEYYQTSEHNLEKSKQIMALPTGVEPVFSD